MFKQKDTDQWLKTMGEQNHMDQNLWRYHDKVYDLEGFMPSHPGGSEWLRITKGQDITDYVQTYHIDIEKVKGLLHKYYVKDAHSQRVSRYDYTDDTLFVKLRKKALEVLPTRESRQPTTEMRTFACGIVGFWILCFWALCSYPSVLTCLIYSYAMLVMQGVGHNFSHQNSIFKHAFDPSWITYRDWMVSHGLSHHTYPNTKLDMEITLFQPFLYILKGDKKNGPLIKVSQFVIFFLTPLQRMLNLLFNPKQIASKPEYLILLIQPLIISLVSGISFKKALLYWYVSQGVNAVVFIFSTFPIHRAADNWVEGPKDQINRDLAIHMLSTTVDHDLGIPLLPSLLLYLGFTDHVVHHIFPGVDKSRISALEPVLMETLEQLSLEHLFKIRSYGDIVKGYMKRLDAT